MKLSYADAGSSLSARTICVNKSASPVNELLHMVSIARICDPAPLPGSVGSPCAAYASMNS
jgi:hypothetical protein